MLPVWFEVQEVLRRRTRVEEAVKTEVKLHFRRRFSALHVD